ncbi:hypothetical protein [Candidatus Sodalis pierantonius]|uniref:hypothetical protein n=1 Tax=Candidatus Sodalis pierantonii TaxID=1486991 RepID=UPI0011DC931B|nr:hypothetical protein [Candidatus Sodalis pierantonius]
MRVAASNVAGGQASLAAGEIGQVNLTVNFNYIKAFQVKYRLHVRVHPVIFLLRRAAKVLVICCRARASIAVTTAQRPANTIKGLSFSPINPMAQRHQRLRYFFRRHSRGLFTG